MLLRTVCSCGEVMAFFPFHFFALSANFPTLAVFIFFLLVGQSSSPCLWQLHRPTSKAFGQRCIINLEASAQALGAAQTLSQVRRTERAREPWRGAPRAGAVAAVRALAFSLP